MRLRQVLPHSGEVDLDGLAQTLDFAGRAPEGRPFVAANMVSSADGRAALDGRSTGLGNAADRALFHRLRTAVDCVLIGAGTLRAERYRPLVRDPVLRAAREAAGLAPDPLAAIVSGRLDLPLDAGLLTDPAQPVAIYTAAARPAALGKQVALHRLAAAELSPASVLHGLHEEHGVRSVLCEGGPTLVGELAASDVLDELFLTLSPMLAGGEDPRIVEGVALRPPLERRLVWALESEGSLFLRYG